MRQAHGIELSPFLATSLRAASILFPIILLPGVAVAQEEVTCPGIPGKFIILQNQPYALCALATSYQFNDITYAKCDVLNGNSMSLQQRFSSQGTTGNINTMNQGQPGRGGYIVSTYSPPAGATNPNGNLAVYTCEGGSSSQCDGGLCFTSTVGRDSPLWGHVGSKQIICSCPIKHTNLTFEVMGPKPCPTTAAAYDAVCGNNNGRNGAITYIGAPPGVTYENFSACFLKNTGGQPVTFNTCTRPAD